MPDYGHRCAVIPRRLRDAWWVCSACMPEFVPRCGIGSAPAPVVDREGGFLGYAAALERLVARTRGPAGSG